MIKNANFVIKLFKYLWRRIVVIIFLVLWFFSLKIALHDLSHQYKWTFVAIITPILIFQIERDYKDEEEYGKLKQTLKWLYDEYKRNINFSIIIDQLRINKNLDELPFSIFELRFINKVIEEGMIKDKKIKERIISELERMTHFNRVWMILAKATLLQNKRIKKNVNDFLECNHQEIYPNLVETKNQVKIYFEKKFNEIL